LSTNPSERRVGLPVGGQDWRKLLQRVTDSGGPIESFLEDRDGRVCFRERFTPMFVAPLMTVPVCDVCSRGFHDGPPIELALIRLVDEVVRFGNRPALHEQNRHVVAVVEDRERLAVAIGIFADDSHVLVRRTDEAQDARLVRQACRGFDHIGVPEAKRISVERSFLPTRAGARALSPPILLRGLSPWRRRLDVGIRHRYRQDQADVVDKRLNGAAHREEMSPRLNMWR
jgi:hypothetical protein